MVVTFSGMVTLVRPEQLLKALAPIVLIFSPNEIVAREVHPKKARCPIDVAASLMVRDCKSWHCPKASLPMEVTLCGMVASFRAMPSFTALFRLNIRLNILTERLLTERKRCKRYATIKGFLADGSDALWNGDARQTTAIIKGMIADRLNIFT